MKKTLSLVLSAVILFCCVLGFQLSAMAMVNKDTAPAVAVGESIAITIPYTGNEEEDAICVATFTPKEDGWYEFMTDEPFAGDAMSDDELAECDLTVYDEDESAVAIGWALDKSCFTPEEIAELEEDGTVDVKHMDRLTCTGYFETGATYYITLRSSSVGEYTANLTVNKHTHEITETTIEGDDDMYNGIYEECDIWYCSYFKLKEIIDTAYEIEEGADQTIARGTDLTVKASGAMWKLDSLKIDGEEIDRDDYELEEGSTIATIKAEYLDTLKTGKHTLEFVYLDGEASTTFTIAEADTTPVAAADKKTTKKDSSKKSPKTGSPVALGMAMMATGAAALYFFRRERDNA